jgi:AbrB family looped-hinge helix DNA binding protein
MFNTTLVVVQKKGVVTIPWHLRDKLGIDVGDMLDVNASNGKIIFAPHKKSAPKSAAKVAAVKTKGKKKVSSRG